MGHLPRGPNAKIIVCFGRLIRAEALDLVNGYQDFVGGSSWNAIVHVYGNNIPVMEVCALAQIDLPGTLQYLHDARLPWLRPLVEVLHLRIADTNMPSLEFRAPKRLLLGDFDWLIFVCYWLISP